MIRIANFDIGKKNFAHYVEDANVKVLEKCKSSYQSLPKKDQRRNKGEMCPTIHSILKTMYKYGKSVHMGVYDLRYDKTVDQLDVQTRKNIITHLNDHKWLWDTCDYIVVEQQFFNTYSGGKKKAGTGANVDAIKIAEDVFIWFLINYPNKKIELFGSQYKTQMLGAPEKLTKYQRKRWSIIEGTFILTLRDDQETLLKTKSYKKGGQKLDDVFDCMTMCQAYKYKYFVACF